MVNQYLHPSDEDLLRLADSELPSRHALRIREHLASCWDCRSRMARMEETIGEFMQLQRQALSLELPPSAGPRAQLKARLGRTVAWRQQRLSVPPFGAELSCPGGGLRSAAGNRGGRWVVLPPYRKVQTRGARLYIFTA